MTKTMKKVLIPLVIVAVAGLAGVIMFVGSENKRVSREEYNANVTRIPPAPTCYKPIKCTGNQISGEGAKAATLDAAKASALQVCSDNVIAEVEACITIEGNNIRKCKPVTGITCTYGAKIRNETGDCNVSTSDCTGPINGEYQCTATDGKITLIDNYCRGSFWQ